jgi:hypothetical protein
MNGFKPLGDLKEWHVWLTIILAICGVIYVIIQFIKIICWFLHHLNF